MAVRTALTLTHGRTMRPSKELARDAQIVRMRAALLGDQYSRWNMRGNSVDTVGDRGLIYDSK